MSHPEPIIILKKGREKSLLRKHPWVFSGAVGKVKGRPAPGQTVAVVSSDGRFLGRGAYCPASQIRVRIWAFDQQQITREFFLNRLTSAIARRKAVPASAEGACRLVHGESDGLPGLIIDRYGHYLVAQFLTAGTERWKQEIVAILADLVPCRGIFERSDAAVRAKEGLSPVKGTLWGQEPPQWVIIEQAGVKILVDVHNGHKTGFYLDQAENRPLVGRYCKGKTVLNCFSYTGGFSLAALAQGAAHVTSIDSSQAALDTAKRNLELNGFKPSRAEFVNANVFDILRKYRDQGRRFDVVILDPPKFVESYNHLKKASRAYKDINLQAMRIISPGGLLATFSCSGLIEPALFQKIVFDASLDAGRQAWIIRRFSQAEDHPVALNFPESAYLKGLLCTVA